MKTDNNRPVGSFRHGDKQSRNVQAQAERLYLWPFCILYYPLTSYLLPLTTRKSKVEKVKRGYIFPKMRSMTQLTLVALMLSTVQLPLCCKCSTTF